MIAKLNVENGKYTFFQPEGDYRIHVLRHGEPWLVIEKGSNAIAALLHENLEELFVKYIRHVGDMEGADYTDDHWKTDECSDEEWKIIQRLATKARAGT